MHLALLILAIAAAVLVCALAIAALLVLWTVQMATRGAAKALKATSSAFDLQNDAAQRLQSILDTLPQR